MKKIGWLLFVTVAALATIPVACKKDITDRTANLPALVSDNLDLNAGNMETCFTLSGRYISRSYTSCNQYTRLCC